MKDCDSFLVYKSVKDNLIKCKYLSYNKDYLKKLSEKFECYEKGFILIHG